MVSICAIAFIYRQTSSEMRKLDKARDKARDKVHGKARDKARDKVHSNRCQARNYEFTGGVSLMNTMSRKASNKQRTRPIVMTMQTVVLAAVTAVPVLGASVHTPAAPAGLEPKDTCGHARWGVRS